jgi:hypothetical protein
MKNIHVLKTDKPTSLFIIEGKLYNYHKPQQCDGVDKINVNIYITSDEQLKYNDYYTVDGKKIYYCNTLNPSRNNHDKKIILTTDQDLIKDGVQAIDDDFLEWFVKNQSCEGVDVYNDKSVGYEYDHYSIIIPKEKTKQEKLLQVAERYSANELSQLGFINGAKWQEQQTIEEVFEWLTTNNYLTDLKETLWLTTNNYLTDFKETLINNFKNK